MSFLDQITVLIPTYNEAPNIGRTLSKLFRFPAVVVLDSGSNDGTQDIVNSFTNTKLFTRPFDAHATQWNFGLNGCGIATPWVLALDADYILPGLLVDEIAGLKPEHNGYRASFDYCVLGRVLSGTLYPPVTVLFRKDASTYIQAGHTQRLKINGTAGALRAHIMHDDRKPLARWFVSQQKYAKLEAEFLLAASHDKLRFTDRIRRLGWPGPILLFFYTMFIKRCILNGWPGWFYVLQRTIAEAMIAAEIVDRRLRKANAAEKRDEAGAELTLP